MSVYPGFRGWINQNMQQRPKADSGRYGSVESNSVSEKDTNLKPWYDEPGENTAMEPGDVRSKALYAVDTKYFDVNEMGRQSKLWHAEKKKHPWHIPPAKFKVETKNGICHMNIEFKVGLIPPGAYEMLTNPRNITFFSADENLRQRLENKATKVLKKDGPMQITDVRKSLRWKFLLFSGTTPIHLIIDENHQNLTAKFTKKKNTMKYMKIFEGCWKLEPLFVDSERLCNQREPKSQEEYKRCSRGKGRIGSTVTMELIFQPSSLLNLPPVSWIIRRIIIKTTKILIEDLRQFAIMMHKM
ncbi:hypothetical protein CARUB_v10012413mg [Capsella rubella]|uniref:DUF220 domain-containing protein n=1 Tax=Capsella rubella TaxID=81985 RepID=R0ILB5_9BRAS|nr:uncharacterized protein LOC17897487 [Capsella rubella]EOA39360.1 hypothetical protein CARUB_v10012413mg [Capsella rubella]